LPVFAVLEVDFRVIGVGFLLPLTTGRLPEVALERLVALAVVARLAEPEEVLAGGVERLGLAGRAIRELNSLRRWSAGRFAARHSTLKKCQC
jgi:hypothetical protein